MSAMPGAAWEAAERAAGRIVGRAPAESVTRAVLAQWIAENGWRWPPPRRNPGNLARGWAAALGCPFTIELPNPQPANPIVTFPTVAVGADCYARGLATFGRYSAAVTRARAGDGLGFAVLVCRAGYGTRESTVRTVYDALRVPVSPGAGPTPGGGDVAIQYVAVTMTSGRMRLAKGQPLFRSPGGSKVTAMSVAGSVPYIGLAGQVDGRPWRAVLVGTARAYSDGKVRPTILYVPASAGEVFVP